MDIKILVIAGMYTYIFFFGISLGATNYPYLAEILPSIGLSFTGVCQWILAFLISIYALNIINILGIFFTFFVFMVISMAGCLLVAGYAVETTGKDDNSIKEAFLSRKFFN